MLHFIIKEGKVYTECMKPYIQNIDKVGLLNPLTDIENVKLKVIATLENAVINFIYDPYSLIVRLTSSRMIFINSLFFIRSYIFDDAV